MILLADIDGIIFVTPPRVIAAINIDNASNEALINLLVKESERFKYIDGVLTHNGQPVTILNNEMQEQFQDIEAVLKDGGPHGQSQLTFILEVLLKAVRKL